MWHTKHSCRVETPHICSFTHQISQPKQNMMLCSKPSWKLLRFISTHPNNRSMYDNLLTTRSQPTNPYPNQINTNKLGNSLAIPLEGVALVTTVLNRAEYPRIHSWTRKEWSSDDCDAMVINEVPGNNGKGRVSQGINVTATFVEEANRNIVNGFRITNMHNLMQQVFNQLHRNNAATAQWKKMTHEAFQFYLYKMYTNFPELWLCEGHWKAICLGSTTYSSWYRNNVTEPKSKAVKKEESTQKIPCKCLAPTISTWDMKKPKPLPTPSPTPIDATAKWDLEYKDNGTLLSKVDLQPLVT